MKYKKIRGESTAACMVKLRQAYGDDVVIMATRQIREGGLFGSRFLSQPLIEIEYMLPERKISRKTIQESLANISERSKDPVIRNLSQKLSALDAPPKADEAPRAPKAEMPASPEEMQALNRLLADEDPILPEKSATPPKIAPQPALSIEPAMNHAVDSTSPSHRHYTKIRKMLLRSKMSASYVDEIISELDHALSRAQKEEYQKVLAAAKELLQARTQVAPGLVPASGAVRGVVFLGPTGAGKTINLAKLAARYYADCEISIYSIDHYRLAATEQLKAYAEIMDLPFHAPHTLEELEERIHRDGSDLLLFDASGVGFRDSERLERLADWVEAICRSIRTERHLCLAANTSTSLLEEILSAYDFVGFDKILLSKLDESDFIGSFIELADKFNKPFSYISDGQVVPNDLRAAEAMELIRLVVEGGQTLAPAL